MMLTMLAVLTTMLLLYAIGFWSTKVYPKARPFRYNPATDAHLPEARSIPLHNTFAAKYQLSDKVLGCMTDAEMIKALAQWSFSLWTAKPGRLAKSLNPLTIVSRAKKGERFARSDYATILGNAMAAVGIPTRLVTLSTRDFCWRPIASQYRGVEYFDREHFKWVWFDAQRGFRIVSNMTPLNCLEIKDAFLRNEMLSMQPDMGAYNVDNYLSQLLPFLDIVIATPLGQNRRYALIPPQLKVTRKKWFLGRTLYDVGCHSLVSFYASHPIKELTRPEVASAIDIQTRQPLSS